MVGLFFTQLNYTILYCLRKTKLRAITLNKFASQLTLGQLEGEIDNYQSIRLSLPTQVIHN